MNLALDRLAAAKLWLIGPLSNLSESAGPRDMPYLSRALYALIPVASNAVETIACDTWWRLYINPEWLEATEINEIGEELFHLIWHLLYEHAGRAASMGIDRSTAEVWHAAADIALCTSLWMENALPPRARTGSSRALPDGLTVEEYYILLLEMKAIYPDLISIGIERNSLDTGCGSCADGLMRTYEQPRDADVGEVGRTEAQMIREVVAIDYEKHLRDRGDAAGSALRWIRGVLEPEHPWPAILAAAVRDATGWAAGRGVHTYTRLSRRSSSTPGFLFPGQYRPAPRVAIIADTSASVDDHLLSKALGEVDGVIMALGVSGPNLTIYSVDAAVHTAQTLRCAKDAKLVGAGGTDMRIGLQALDSQRPRPDVAIVFTDGDTPWPVNPPRGIAVIVAVLGRQGEGLPQTPDWAVRVECLLPAI